MATSTIKNKFDMIIRTVSHTYTGSVAANGTYHFNIGQLIKDDLPDGYMLAGIAGYTTGTPNLIASDILATDLGNWSCQIKNVTSSAVTSNYPFKVSYLAVKF